MKTTVEAALLLGITRQRVLQLLQAGLLKGQKFGRDWQIDPESLRRYKPVPRGRPRLAAKQPRHP